MARDASDKCWPISGKRKVPETPELVGRLPTPRAIMRTSFSSKIKIIRPTNAESGRASYLPNGKAYKLEAWYTDGYEDEA